MEDEEVMLVSLFNNLQNTASDEARLITLGKINTLVRHKPAALQSIIKGKINLDLLFDILKYKDSASQLAIKTFESIVELVGDILPFFTKYRERILSGLKEENEDVKRLCLKVILKLTTLVDISEGELSLDFVTTLVFLIGSPSLGLSEMATEILLRIGAGEVQTSLFDSTVLLEWEKLFDISSTVRFRIYDFFAKLCCRKNNYYSQAYSRKVFSRLISEVNCDDELSQMVALVILSTVANSGPSGMCLISERDFLGQVRDILQRSSRDTSQSYLFCAAMTFFGSVGHDQTDLVLSDYPEVFQEIFANQESDDLTVSVLCFETLFSLMHQDSGLIRIVSTFPEVKLSLKTFGRILATTINDIYIGRLLESIAQLFTRFTNTVEISETLKDIYFSICNQPLGLFHRHATRPVKEVRLSAFKVFKAIAHFEWGEKDMAMFAGFVDFLLNRNTEFEKEGRELKYDIIKVLADSTTSFQNLGLNYYTSVKRYVKEGPFYSERDAAVSFEKKD